MHINVILIKCQWWCSFNFFVGQHEELDSLKQLRIARIQRETVPFLASCCKAAYSASSLCSIYPCCVRETFLAVTCKVEAMCLVLRVLVVLLWAGMWICFHIVNLLSLAFTELRCCARVALNELPEGPRRCIGARQHQKYWALTVLDSKFANIGTALTKRLLEASLPLANCVHSGGSTDWHRSSPAAPPPPSVRTAVPAIKDAYFLCLVNE